jgi:hypothetical protein
MIEKFNISYAMPFAMDVLLALYLKISDNSSTQTRKVTGKKTVTELLDV